MRTSVLPHGVTLEGELRGSGDLIVRGTLIGNVDLDGMLTVDSGAVLRGEVRARAMVVRGEVEGPVTVLELLRLEAGARVLGDVQADRVSAAGGSVLRGRVRMTGVDKLRRTVGGTLTAPFTSSGTIEAPIELRREVRPVIGAERLSTLTGSPAPGVRERATEPPGVRDRRPMRERTTDTPLRERNTDTPLRERNTDTPVRSQPRATSPATANPLAAPVAVSAPSALANSAAPPPVVPRLGRVRSQRRDGPT